MRRGILPEQLSRFDKMGELIEEKSAWKWWEGFNVTYTFTDAMNYPAQRAKLDPQNFLTVKIPSRW